jgi:hypothetical protein
MSRGKSPSDKTKPKPEETAEKKPEPEGDRLAELIDDYAQEIEPVRPENDDGEGDPGK